MRKFGDCDNKETLSPLSTPVMRNYPYGSRGILLPGDTYFAQRFRRRPELARTRVGRTISEKVESRIAKSSMHSHGLNRLFEVRMGR